MATAIIILSAVIMLCLLTICILGSSLTLAVEQLNGRDKDELLPPEVEWDYVAGRGWSDEEESR